MNFSSEFLVSAILVGVGATLFMDLWALLLRAFGVAPPNYCIIGRWLCHMPAGRFVHGNIGEAAAKPAECAVGWVFHYAVGIAYAFLLLAVTPAGWLAQPTLLPALLLGVATVVVPYFVMQPCLGLGIAAAKTPNPMEARLKSLMNHTVFGIGLYVAALLLSTLS